MQITAIIPARGGSKGIPDKNIRLIHGKPLICWSIEQALAAKGIGRVIVSTDSPEIATIAKRAGADVPALRPVELALDTTPTEPVLLHTLNQWCIDSPPDAIMLLQPTSPLRLNDTIDQAIHLFTHGHADSLVSVCENHAFFWKNPDCPAALYDYHHRPRRQDILPEDRQYRENGSIYLTRSETLRQCSNRLGGKIVMHVMTEAESWEIDSETDFLVVQTLLERYI